MCKRPIPHVNSEDTGRGHLNKYIPQSILNELRWALDPASKYPEEAYLEIGEDLWYDPHLNALMPIRRQAVIESRTAMTSVVSEVASCRIIVITLGLVEAWWDTETQLYINGTPHEAARKNYLDRFELHVLDYNDILQSLQDTHALLKKYGHPDFRILITVSPVPLIATWTSRDVLIANSYSKSVLRAATEKFSYTHDDVDYFPSYESISLSEKSKVWEKDGRHVLKTAVAENVNRMLSSYLPASQ